jgi:small subunit ribosomal protein S10
MTSVQLQKLRISVKAYETHLLDSSCSKIIDAVKASGIEAVGPIPLPTKTRRYCVLTSPHVNKDAREHFEIRTHKRIIDVYKPSDNTLENLRNLDISAGVDVSSTVPPPNVSTAVSTPAIVESVANTFADAVQASIESGDGMDACTASATVFATLSTIAGVETAVETLGGGTVDETSTPAEISKFLRFSRVLSLGL